MLKTTLIIIGVLLLLGVGIFCYLLIAGADESRRRPKDAWKREADASGLPTTSTTDGGDLSATGDRTNNAGKTDIADKNNTDSKKD